MSTATKDPKKEDGDDGKDHIRNDPSVWVATCRRLINAIKVLERGTQCSSGEEYADSSLAGLLLAGFAFENAFKAYYLSLGKLLYKRGKQTGLKYHEYTVWADENGLELSESERRCLGLAEFACKSWGRYPFHNDKSEERHDENWSWGDVRTLVQVSLDLIEKSGGFTIREHHRDPKQSLEDLHMLLPQKAPSAAPADQ
jgi:hypothetical protein